MKKIYWAGDLFDSKDLIGNLLLADAVERCSDARYRVMLPQDGECEVVERTSRSIRDADFELLFNCDVLVANFDGHDLDSGTVVEFCFAKSIDMPSVLLRTDFRNSGDHSLPDGEPWNLMCSHYPRTEVLHVNAMNRYHELCDPANKQRSNSVQSFYESIAVEIIEALDRVCIMPSWLEQDQVFQQYQMSIKSIGGSLGRRLDEKILHKIVAGKIKNGVY